MSKLPNSLKALINAPKARPNTVPAPPNIRSVYQKIQQTAQSNNVSQPSWLALSVSTTLSASYIPKRGEDMSSRKILISFQTAATMTMNSPESLAILFQLATASQSTDEGVSVAELMREVGLKCISFNGIPRTINCLNVFKASLPDSVAEKLSRSPARAPTPENIDEIAHRGRALWDSIYRPFESKLYSKLADSHPDLPVHILNSHYGALLSDPANRRTGATAGRISTSIVAVACLRAQSGVGPQVTSHVFGLRKALEDGTWVGDAESEEGAKWLASDEGNTWILKSVDDIVESISEGTGSNFAPSRGSKL